MVVFFIIAIIVGSQSDSPPPQRTAKQKSTATPVPPKPTATPDSRLSNLSEDIQYAVYLDILYASRQPDTDTRLAKLPKSYGITQDQITAIQQKGQRIGWKMPTPTPVPTSTPEPTATPDPEKIRKDKIERQFSAWDGSHQNLVRVVKEAMHDPDSFDHLKTVYWDKGDKLVVKMDFRGKNTFGALVKNTVYAETDLEGNILSIQQE